MKLTVFLALAALTVASADRSGPKDYIDEQFLIRLDETKLTTQSQIHEFSEMLEQRFKIYQVKSYSFGKVQLLFVKGNQANVIKAKSLSAVRYIQQNQVYRTAQSCMKQSAPGCWGLDRTDQVSALPYTDPFSSSATYTYGEDMGTGSVVYVMDTGIDHTHPDFSGRARHGFTTPEIPNDEDVHGHGTHCAGTVGSDSYGVAKDVELVAVKILSDNGFGSTTGILDGYEWIAQQHEERSDTQIAKTVISMSISGPADDAYDEVTESMVDDGCVVVAAAGNANTDACFYSPARVPSAITVGASSVNDVLWYASNFGDCVDIYAPGDVILSTLPGDTTAYYSGTSMATPHVAGVVARYQSSMDATPTPEEVCFR